VQGFVDFGVPHVETLCFNGTDPTMFFPPKVPRSTSGAASAVRIIMVGRVEAEKGWDFFLRHFSSLASALVGLEWELHIVGGGTMLSNVKQTLATNKKAPGMPSNLVYHGSVSHNVVPDLLRKADVYLSCSCTENFGLANLEALFCGLPVIAPHSKGTSSVLVVDGCNGLLFDLADRDSFTR
jgi:glycosyltransferase involved in cell wall biosynthesis